MLRGLPISTWVLLVVSVCAGPALHLLRRWAEARRGRRGEDGSAGSGTA